MTRNGMLGLLAIALLAVLSFFYFGTDFFQRETTDPVVASVVENEAAPTADDLANTDEKVLTVINTLTGAEVTLTEDKLKALPQARINTENEFVDAMTAFDGPLGRDVLALVGESGTMVVLTAVNDYAVEVPIEDFINYDVVFAVSADGAQFSRRDKGPIWVVYPMSDHIELQDPVYNARLIWQLVKVEIK